MQVFREAKLPRARRQLDTMTRAVLAGRSRTKSQHARMPVDAEALIQVLRPFGAGVQLLKVPVNRPRWPPPTIHVDVGDRITWLAWGHVDLLKPLGVAVGPSMGLLCRVGSGKPLGSGGRTRTFPAGCKGFVQ